MDCNYEEALSYIHGISRFGKRPGLENIERLMRDLGNPQKDLRFVHIAGTNGKGSTAAMLASVMREAGFRTGLYTSPYLQRFAERIQVNGGQIPDKTLVRLTRVVRDAIKRITDDGYSHPTELEVVAAIAFLFFRETDCDVVVLEVGLGGRFDPTNVIDSPLAAVITTIDYDHVERLGGTLEKIAFEKAGIIKHGTNVVLYPAAEGVARVIEDAAKDAGASVTVCDFLSLREGAYDLHGQRFDYRHRKDLKITLLGGYQLRNAALVIDTVDVINSMCESGVKANKQPIRISEDALRRGLETARWPGRMELLRKSNPTMIIDAAHNPQCSRALRDSLSRHFPSRRCVLIFGVLEDKDYTGIITPMLPLADAIFTVTPSGARAIPAKRLAGILRTLAPPPLSDRVYPCESVADAVRLAAEYAAERGGSAPDAPLICAFGSLYFIGDVRQHSGL